MTVGSPAELSSKPRALSHPGQLDLCLDLNSGEKHGHLVSKPTRCKGELGGVPTRKGAASPSLGQWDAGAECPAVSRAWFKSRYDTNNVHAGAVSGLFSSVSQTETVTGSRYHSSNITLYVSRRKKHCQLN